MGGWQNILPQFNSSELSEQSGLKSHSLVCGTHSPCAPHTNSPSGQLWGCTVGGGVVTTGIVVFNMGSSPITGHSRKYKSTVQMKTKTVPHCVSPSHVLWYTHLPSYGTQSRKEMSSMAMSPLKSSPTVPSIKICH